MRVLAASLAAVLGGSFAALLALAQSPQAAEPPDGPLTSAGGDSVAAEPPLSLGPVATRPPGEGAASAGRRNKAVSFRRLLVTLAPGETWGAVETGRFCFGSRPLTWTAASAEMKTPQFIAAFRSKFESLGIKVAVAAAPGASLPPNVYNVYARVTRLNGDFCLPRAADMDAVKGHVTLAIQWRLFTPLGREPIADVATTSEYKRRTVGLGGVEGMLDAVFAQNLDQLLEAPEVLRALAPDAASSG